MLASRKGNVEGVRALLAKGADINRRHACVGRSDAAISKTGLKFLFKPVAIFAAIFLALGSSPLRAAEPAPDPASFDILGMKLGMSVEEIQAAIKAHDPSLVIRMNKVPITGAQITGSPSGGSDTSLNFGVGNFVQLLLTASPVATAAPAAGGSNSIEVRFTVTEPSRALYIYRQASFRPGQQPLMDKTVQQLREKYGSASISLQRLRILNSSGTTLYWAFGNDGAQIPTIPPFDLDPGFDPHFDRAVDSSGNQINQVNKPTLGKTCRATSSYRPSSLQYSSRCGMELLATLQPPADTHLLFLLDEKLIGDSIAVDDIQKLMAAAKAEQERQRQQQEQKASALKPPL